MKGREKYMHKGGETGRERKQQWERKGKDMSGDKHKGREREWNRRVGINTRKESYELTWGLSYCVAT